MGIKSMQHPPYSVPLVDAQGKVTRPWVATIDSFSTSTLGTSTIAVGIHNDLTGRSESDAHPIQAITGLSDALSAIGSSIDSVEAVNASQDSSILAIQTSLGAQSSINASVEAALATKLESVYTDGVTITGTGVVGDPLVATDGGITRYAGVIFPGPEWVSLGGADIRIPACTVNLYDNANWSGPTSVYTTPTKDFTLVDDVDNLLVVDYNSGTPEYRLLSYPYIYNNSNIVAVYRLWYEEGVIHSQSADSIGSGMAEKGALRTATTDYYKRTQAGGLDLSETSSPAERTVIVSSANVFAGVVPNTVLAFNSSVDSMRLYVKTSGVWATTAVTQYPNIYYNDNAGLIEAGGSKFVNIYVYRSIGDTKECFLVLSKHDFSNVEDAKADQPRSDVPALVTQHCMLTGRIIVRKSEASGLVQSAFTQVFGSTAPTLSMDDLTDVAMPSPVEGDVPYRNSLGQYVPFNMKSVSTATKDVTGWEANHLITVTYDGATRKVTLTTTEPTLRYWYNNVVTDLGTNTWTSTAHDNTAGIWYLYSTDGVAFSWYNAMWEFYHIMVHTVRYTSSTKYISIREVHGLMPWTDHRYGHRNSGTVRLNAITTEGIVGGYVIGDYTTAANRRPSCSEINLLDEDLPTLVSALVDNGPYSHLWITGATSSDFSIGTNAEIVYMSGTIPQYTTTAGVRTDISSNSYANCWLVAIPATSEATAQAMRWVWVQPQMQHANLSLAQAETWASLAKGDLFGTVSEFLPVAQVTIKREASNFSIAATPLIITGSRNGGGVTSSGGAITTLQQAYEVSSDPEITLNATRGAFSIKAITDGNNAIEILNSAGSTTASITGAGRLDAIGVYTPSISSTAGLSISPATTLGIGGGGDVTISCGGKVTINTTGNITYASDNTYDIGVDATRPRYIWTRKLQVDDAQITSLISPTIVSNSLLKIVSTMAPASGTVRIGVSTDAAVTDPDGTLQVGAYNAGSSCIWSGGIASPSTSNYGLYFAANQTAINAATGGSVVAAIANSTKAIFNDTQATISPAGAGASAWRFERYDNATDYAVLRNDATTALDNTSYALWSSATGTELNAKTTTAINVNNVNRIQVTSDSMRLKGTGTASFLVQNLSGSTSAPAIYNGLVTPDTTNYTIGCTTTTTGINATTSVSINVAGAAMCLVDSTGLKSDGKVTSISPSGGVGYATGAGGSVTQNTSKTTAFTLSKVCGKITFANSALASQTNAACTWTNTAINTGDVVVFNHISGGTLCAYNITCTSGSGTATITLRNITAGSLTEAPVFSFAIIKAVST